MPGVRSAKWAGLLLIGWGCGETPKPAEDPAAAASVAATSAAPGSAALGSPTSAAPRPLPQQLIGAWQVDLDYIKTDSEMLALPPDKRAKAMTMAKALLKDLRIVFGADKTVSVGGKMQTSRGTYRAWATAPDTLAVEAKLITANEAEEQETLTVKFVDERVMITGKDGKATRFKRAPVAR